MTAQVVITGTGAVTPLGPTLQATRDAFAAGHSAIDICTVFDASAFKQSRAGEVRDFDPRAHFRATKAIKLTDRMTRFAVAASGMALADGRWPEDTGAELGVALGCAGYDLHAGQVAGAMFPDPDGRSAEDIPFFTAKVLSRLTPLWLLTVLPNMTSSHVAIQFGATGPNTTVTSGAAAGLQAIGEAADWIRHRQCDAVLAGGTDSCLTATAYAALQQAGGFDRPDAPPPAEGALVVLLEDARHAHARGATPIASIEGHATRAGACAATRAIAATLDESGWSAADVDCLCLAGPRDLAGFPSHARRLTVDTAIGDAAAAAAPIALGLALSGVFGTKILCVVESSIGPAAALAVDLGEAARP